LAGGVILATTGREVNWLGGIELTAPTLAPKTLAFDGAISGTIASGALFTCSLDTCTAALATGCAFVSAAAGTAVKPPGTV
jgi:hypothetical protein